MDKEKALHYHLMGVILFMAYFCVPNFPFFASYDKEQK